MLNFCSTKENVWILWNNSIFSFFKNYNLSFLKLSSLKYLSFWFLSTLLIWSLVSTNITSANSDSIFTIEWLNLNQEHISSNWWNWNNVWWNNQKWEQKITNEDKKWKLNYKDLDEYQKKYYMDWLNKIMNEWKFQWYNFERQQLIDIDWNWLKDIVFRYEKSWYGKMIYSIHFNWQTFELKKYHVGNNENDYWYEDYFVLEKNGKRKFLLLSRYHLFIWLHESTSFWKTINYEHMWTQYSGRYKKINNSCLNFTKNWIKTYISINSCHDDSIQIPSWFFKYTHSWKDYWRVRDAFTKFWNEEEYLNTSIFLDKDVDKRLEQDDIFSKWYIFSILKFSIKDNQKTEIYYYNDWSIERYVLDENSWVYIFKEWTEESQWWWNNLFDFVWEDDENQPKNNEWKILKTTEDQLVTTTNWDWTKNYMIQTEWEEIALSLWWKHWIYFKDLTWDWLKEVITYELMKSESIDKYFKLDIYTYKDWEYKKILDWVRWTYLTNFDSNNDWIQDLAIRWLDWKINTYVFTWDTSQQTTEIEWDEIIFNDINWDWNKDVITKKKIQWTKDLWYFNFYLFENWSFVKKTWWQWILWNWTQFSTWKILWTKLIWIQKSKWYKVLYFDKSQNIFKDLQSWKVLKTLWEDYLLTLNWWKRISFIDSDWKFYIYEIKDNTLKNTKIVDISKDNWRCVNCTDQELNDLEEQFTEIQLPSDTTFKSKWHILWDDAFILWDHTGKSYLLLKKWDHLVKMKDHVNHLDTWSISWDLLVWNRDRWVLVKEDTWKIESLNWIATKTWWTQDTSKILNLDINKLTYSSDNSTVKESDILYWISWRKSVRTERIFIPSNFKIWYKIFNWMFHIYYQNTFKIKVWWLLVQENFENEILWFAWWYRLRDLWIQTSDLYFESNVNELENNPWKSKLIVSKIEQAYRNQLQQKYCSDDYSARNTDDLCWKYRWNYSNAYRPKSDYYWILYNVWNFKFFTKYDTIPFWNWSDYGNHSWCKIHLFRKEYFSNNQELSSLNWQDIWALYCHWWNNTTKQYQDLKKIFLYKD